MADAPRPPTIHAALHHFREAFDAQLDALADELRRAVAGERDDVARETQRIADADKAASYRRSSGHDLRPTIAMGKSADCRDSKTKSLLRLPSGSDALTSVPPERLLEHF